MTSTRKGDIMTSTRKDDIMTSSPRNGTMTSTRKEDNMTSTQMNNTIALSLVILLAMVLAFPAPGIAAEAGAVTEETTDASIAEVETTETEA